jgi:predicted DNA binding CopG/RHH family protein
MKNTMEIRDKNFTVRLTQTEYDYIKQQAEKHYMSIGAYIRFIVVEGGWKK